MICCSFVLQIVFNTCAIGQYQHSPAPICKLKCHDVLNTSPYARKETSAFSYLWSVFMTLYVFWFFFFFLILLQNCTWCKDETAVPKRLPPFTKKKYPTSFYKHHTRKNILYPKAFQASILTTVLLPLHGVFTKGKEEWKQAVNHCIGNYKNKKSSKV